MRSIGCRTEKAAISGDPTFLLQPKDAKPMEPALSFAPKDELIGMNWGTAMNQIYGGSEAAVENELASAAKYWIRQGYSIVLYAMWPKDAPAIKRLMGKIGSAEQVRFIDTVDPYQIMHIIGQCRFTVNFKLHAAVLSAVMRIPFIALGYRFKVFDFAASIQSLPYVVSTDDPAVSERITRLSE
ncbi:polysaccharide pyruvyl transferase family protein, partial [Cutibacterium acnes]